MRELKKTLKIWTLEYSWVNEKKKREMCNNICFRKHVITFVGELISFRKKSIQLNYVEDKFEYFSAQICRTPSALLRSNESWKEQNEKSNKMERNRKHFEGKNLTPCQLENCKITSYPNKLINHRLSRNLGS